MAIGWLCSMHIEQYFSALLLCNYWLEFNETFWESSILRGDAHIIALFWSLRVMALD
jgi:hypothetical protein